jgi:cytochrome oxidase Cu insertion factor (SCO1/SenC/PrrC family)
MGGIAMKNALTIAVLVLAAFLGEGWPAAEDPAPAPTDLERVHEGAAAPDFTLLSRTGDRVTLSDYRESRNIILIFYRGYW